MVGIRNNESQVDQDYRDDEANVEVVTAGVFSGKCSIAEEHKAKCAGADHVDDCSAISGCLELIRVDPLCGRAGEAASETANVGFGYAHSCSKRSYVV